MAQRTPPSRASSYSRTGCSFAMVPVLCNHWRSGGHREACRLCHQHHSLRAPRSGSPEEERRGPSVAVRMMLDRRTVTHAPAADFMYPPKLPPSCAVVERRRCQVGKGPDG